MEHIAVHQPSSTEPADAPVGATTTAQPTVDDGDTLGGFEVEPAALRRAASAFGSESDLLGEATTRLVAHINSLGECWGDDRVGHRFGVTYRPAAEQVAENLGSLTVGLLRFASALTAVADSYEVVDDAAAIGAPPGGGLR